ncbi:Stk1 family PASTA domain-containing Ser/Thr kinase [Parenemella sanctibonifatiensis]|uniref:non-specific serine/threonine protein kinase n=1 Tax=Parenemella sanctibonifatiensis TaxID=2016505 RepID=A0A255ED51_9ACTN|nr:Stk1 family PASTA domain-containing Ser/Thr kinase [Parenemella sanctibonifatiensis]OYN89466.1 serine/threonine protein kinase [Parenemella sanctibonifatiensis]
MSEGRAEVIGDRYALGEVLGRGGMALVRRATDTRLGREVAIKTLRTDLATDPTFQARFRREAQSAAGLNHPNIVSVYDTGEQAIDDVQVPYIVMELVEGKTLRDVLREDGKVMPERALELSQGVLDALSYSHRSGIVHRDIKPANVMLTPQGQVKVMDFGIARAVADTSATMTQTAAVIGTAQYLSPEQARGESVDARSDIYSAGCLLYELLTGRPPFQGDSPVSVAYQHVREIPQPPSHLDPAITPDMDAIVLKSLAKDPAERFQSAQEMRSDIARLLAGQAVTAVIPASATSPDPDPTQALAPAPAYAAAPAAAPVTPAANPEEEDEDEEEKGSKAPIVLTVVALLLAVALIGGAVWFFRDPQPSPSPSASPSPVQATVPSVIGMTREQAEQRLRDEGLVPKVEEVEESDGSSVGTVLRQNPTANTTLAPGSEVTIVVNVGLASAEIPDDLIGKSESDARQALEDAGFTNIRTQEATSEPSTAEAGEVLDVDPSEGTDTTLDSQITLTVATGQVEMPNLQGYSQTEAQQVLDGLGLTNVQFQERESSGETGVVVGQEPSPRQKISKDDKVVIFISIPAPTPTPEPTPTPTPTPTATPTR